MLVFGLSPRETQRFLGECGLNPIFDIGPEDAETRYLTRKDGGILRRTLGHIRIVHARNHKQT